MNYLNETDNFFNEEDHLNSDSIHSLPNNIINRGNEPLFYEFNSYESNINPIENLLQNLPFQNTSPFTNYMPMNEKTNKEINIKSIISENQNNQSNNTLPLELNIDNFKKQFSKEEIKNNQAYKNVESIEIKSKEEKNNEKNNFSNKTVEKPQFLTKKISKFGRKSNKDKKNGKQGLHTKDNEDNKIRKIKSNFGQKVYKLLSKYFKNKKTCLLKLDNQVRSCLKKKDNLILFNTKLKDIYSNTEISSKYKSKAAETNKLLINEIYKENKNIELIKILELTYLEIFEIFRRNLTPKKQISPQLKKKIEGTKILDPLYFEDAEIFIKEEIDIREKNNEGKDDINKYIKDLKKLILELEKWFINKKGRD